MSDLNGCGGSLCRAMKRKAAQFDCARYDDSGELTLDYRLCGIIICGSQTASSRITDIPGRACSGGGECELLVIASAESVEEGDLLTYGEDSYRISERICAEPLKFILEEVLDDG